MRIAHFNTFLNGGAAVAARRIHEGLRHFRRTIVSSQLYHRDGESQRIASPSIGHPLDSPESSDLQPMPVRADQLSRFRTPLAYRRNKQRQYRIFDQFNTHLAGRSPDLESFSMAELPNSTSLDWPAISADIVHLHWVSHLIDYPSFFGSIPPEVPIVWTLHDMNPFSGGCHYADHCRQYQFGCGDCPQVIQPHGNDVSRSTLQAKREALANRQVTVVTPSVWMADQAQVSPIWPDDTDFQVIRYGLDLQQFSPMCKRQARRDLGIDSEAVLVGFGAADLRAPRKGMQHLISALQIVARENRQDTGDAIELEGVIFGAGNFHSIPGLPTMRSLGFADSPEKLRRIYSAVDLVVVPSREDNQPQVGLEAMACGTPVIGFASGGIPEFVRQDETGRLVALGDEVALAHQILALGRNRQLRTKLGSAARKMIETEFEIVQQSARYIELYQSILKGLSNQHHRQAA